jgi:hypothetical protein
VVDDILVQLHGESRRLVLVFVKKWQTRVKKERSSWREEKVVFIFLEVGKNEMR